MTSLIESVRKTKRAIVVDTSNLACSVSSEIAARLQSACFSELADSIVTIGNPDYPCPTAPSLSKDYYPRCADIVEAVKRLLGRVDIPSMEDTSGWRDQPDQSFTGPF